MFKSIFISMIMLFLLAGLTYSQDSFNGGKYGFGKNEGAYQPPYNPDWMGSDIVVYNHSGTTNNVMDRTLDMEYCEENGRLYIAACVNISGWHGIRVYSSNNSGLTWTFEGGLWNHSTWWSGLSMKVEQRRNGYLDSVRVNIFYTESASSNNNGAELGFLSFRPHASTGAYVYKIIGTPSAGNEFRWPSAYSNGQFQSGFTDIGCVVGEYNNAGTVCNSLKKYYMANWGWGFAVQSLATPFSDMFFPSAVYKNNPTSNYDSIYIAVENRTTGRFQIDLLRTRAWGGGGWPATTIMTNPGVYYRNPCLTIPQNRYPTRMVITYTQNTTSTASRGRGRRSYSYNGGVSWTHGYLSNSYTTKYTWVASDSNGSSGYCTFIWGDNDSLNVRRASINASGTTFYDRASNLVTNTCFPVCAVYNNSSGNYRRSTFAYWRYLSGTGVNNIYFDAENLPTGITNTNGIANTYSLSQNYPNPFNPATTINFSIPKDGIVTLTVYDMLGKEVATLVNGEQTAGSYQVAFDASKLTSGVYFYKITSGDFSDVKKMLLVK